MAFRAESTLRQVKCVVELDICGSSDLVHWSIHRDKRTGRLWRSSFGAKSSVHDQLQNRVSFSDLEDSDREPDWARRVELVNPQKKFGFKKIVKLGNPQKFGLKNLSNKTKTESDFKKMSNFLIRKNFKIECM
jgi:hypothetical protein